MRLSDPRWRPRLAAVRYNQSMTARVVTTLWCLFVLAGCGIRLDSVSAEVAPGGTLEIAGAGFTDQTQFSLSGSVEIALQVGEQSPTAVSATVPQAAPAGTYTLRASAAGAKAELPDAVRVVSGGLEIHFLDIGQGDATLVVAPSGASLLIDGGPRSAAGVVKDAIRVLARGRLDAVVLSHTDADHLGGLVELLQGDDGAPGSNDDLVPELRLTGIDDGSCTSQVCGDLRRLRAWPFQTPDVGDTIAALAGDGIEATVVAVDGDVGGGKIAGADDDNERCVAVRLAFGGNSVLITGDLTGGGAGEADVESALATRIGPIDVLRASHHGSATSSAAAALAAWQPRAIVLSLGTDNAYCHPAPEIIARLGAQGAPIFATGQGIVADTARCDGATEWPAQARPGLGSITLELRADGTMILAGDAI